MACCPQDVPHLLQARLPTVGHAILYRLRPHRHQQHQTCLCACVRAPTLPVHVLVSCAPVRGLASVSRVPACVRVQALQPVLCLTVQAWV